MKTTIIEWVEEGDVDGLGNLLSKKRQTTTVEGSWIQYLLQVINKNLLTYVRTYLL